MFDFNSVRIHDLMDLKEPLSTITIEDENRVENCGWSVDGRLLGVTGASGNVYMYLTRLNLLASVWQPTGLIAVLTSLKEVIACLPDAHALPQYVLTYGFWLSGHII